MFCQGSHDFYGHSVDYYGVPADDSPTFDLSGYFFPAADYIQKALDADGGKSCCLNVRFYTSQSCQRETLPAKFNMLCIHCISFFFFLFSSGFSSLRCRSEQVCLSRPGLPDDPPPLHPVRGHQYSQRAQVDFPKQGIPQTASSFGRETAQDFSPLMNLSISLAAEK